MARCLELVLNTTTITEVKAREGGALHSSPNHQYGLQG